MPVVRLTASVTVWASTRKDAEMKLRAIGESGQVCGILGEVLPFRGGLSRDQFEDAIAADRRRRIEP